MSGMEACRARTLLELHHADACGPWLDGFVGDDFALAPVQRASQSNPAEQFKGARARRSALCLGVLAEPLRITGSHLRKKTLGERSIDHAVIALARIVGKAAGRHQPDAPRRFSGNSTNYAAESKATPRRRLRRGKGVEH